MDDHRVTRHLTAILEDLMTARVLPSEEGCVSSLMIAASTAAIEYTKPMPAKERALVFPALLLLFVYRLVDVVDMPPDWPWSREEMLEEIHKPLALESFLREKGGTSLDKVFSLTPPGPPPPTVYLEND